jgi:cytochrome c553
MYKKIYFALSAVAALMHHSAFAGDYNLGQEKAATCAACHQMNGNSMIPTYPKIGGQHAPYLRKQLLDYREAMFSGGMKGRHNPIMGAMVMALSDQDIDDLATYYSKQNIPTVAKQQESNTIDVDAMKAIEAGRQLYQGGNKERKIAACTSCHGWQGDGVSAAGFPKLNQQNALYIEQQLHAFKAQERRNDMNHMMRSTARKLTEEDIKSLVVYIQSLTPS